MSRPQIGIERLPAAVNRRMSNNETRESMNCKSCRKRKIKCNRLRPTCEACQVFQCPCIYDAVPKKRGPKTDVLEALLKRVDGLERRLKDEKKSHSPSNERGPGKQEDSSTGDTVQSTQLNTNVVNAVEESAMYSPTPTSVPSPTVPPDVLLDTFFLRVHGKVYYVLDETIIRQRLQTNQVPNHLLYAIYAVSARYAAHPNGYHATVRLSEDYAIKARADLDTDDPSLDALQTLILLSVAFIAAGKGKKAYMLMASGIGMAIALELHRELHLNSRATPVEREMRRRLFWTCYLIDRFSACDSKRPSLIADEAIFLRLPSWSPNEAALPVEGDYFQNRSNLQYGSGTGKKSQGSSGMLIDIVRILGITNRYLAAGGVKGDSHFPWHSLSNLSKIRQELDLWASGTQDTFTLIDTLFGQPDSTTLLLSKLVYHLIHCLIYRPFLPIDLLELAGTGQHQSWQIEATNLCFLHANATAELVELAKQAAAIEWPAFLGYCICTAGTVHVHGAHYKSARDGEVFAASADFLSREMQQLSELRYAWASVQHQRDTLQIIYNCHSELVNSLASNPMRYSPVFQLEDFFDRYSTLGKFFDGAHISFVDATADVARETFTGHDLYAPRVVEGGGNGSMNDNAGEGPSKRKSSSTSWKRFDKTSYTEAHVENPLASPDHLTVDQLRQTQQSLMSIPQQQLLSQDTIPSLSSPNIPFLSAIPFSPPYSFSSMVLSNQQEGFDPMFGMPQMIPSSDQTFSGFEYNQNQLAMTPGGRSNGESTGSREEKDPFLSLLEQLAENEHSRGGPSDLDFFLTGQG